MVQSRSNIFARRNGEFKDGARQIRGRPQPAVVSFDDRTGDKQPQPQTAGLGRARLSARFTAQMPRMARVHVSGSEAAIALALSWSVRATGNKLSRVGALEDECFLFFEGTRGGHVTPRRVGEAISSLDGRNDRCSHWDSAPDSFGARVPPPRSHQREQLPSQSCPAKGQKRL